MSGKKNRNCKNNFLLGKTARFSIGVCCIAIVKRAKPTERKRERTARQRRAKIDSKQNTKRRIVDHDNDYVFILISNRWGGNYLKLLNWREFCLFISTLRRCHSLIHTQSQKLKGYTSNGTLNVDRESEKKRQHQQRNQCKRTRDNSGIVSRFDLQQFMRSLFFVIIVIIIFCFVQMFVYSWEYNTEDDDINCVNKCVI